MLLEDLVESCLGRTETIELVGSPGSGKSIALSHLAARFGSDEMLLIDDATPAKLSDGTFHGLRIYTTRSGLELADRSYRMAPWSRDDILECLLATYSTQCAQLYHQLVADDLFATLAGNPELIRVVLDEMATSTNCATIPTALRHRIAKIVGDDVKLERTRFLGAALLLREFEVAVDAGRAMSNDGLNRAVYRLLQAPLVQKILCVDYAIHLLKTHHELPFPAHALPRDVVQAIGQEAAADPEINAQLEILALAGPLKFMAMAVSILLEIDRSWQPRRGEPAYLKDAYLADADWNSVDLAGSDLRQADLNGARCQNGNLSDTKLDRANLCHLSGRRLQLANAQAPGADFTRADLSDANMSAMNAACARLAVADLTNAKASHARFEQADLNDAILRGADLRHCRFAGANLDRTDLRDALLIDAHLARLDLRAAYCDGAIMDRAHLTGANLEGVTWSDVSLVKAQLHRAHLTGSRLRRVDLSDANLTCTGLADVDWEGVNLRAADLRGSTFHMGSTRSGLVGSPYPSHGTRTGFYTDDFEDRSYKTPEMIRKANLCGVDLREANITGVDFYLVDLRGAKFDRHQEQHFRRCDAILDD